MVDPTQKLDVEIPEQLPVLPLRNMVLFPGVPTQLLVGREGSLQLVNQALEGSRLIAVAAQRDVEIEEPGPEDLYPVGVVAVIHRVFKLPDNHLQILVRGIKRVTFTKFLQEKPYLIAEPELLGEVALGDQQEMALAQNLSQQFQKMSSLVPAMGDELQVTAINLEKQPVQLADFIASGIDLDIQGKQEILQEKSVRGRLEQLTVLLNRELSVLEMGQKIQNQVQEEMGQIQREHFLREQMRIIQKELGEDENDEIEALHNQISKARLPEEALAEAERELERLRHMSNGAAEYTVART